MATIVNGRLSWAPWVRFGLHVWRCGPYTIRRHGRAHYGCYMGSTGFGWAATFRAARAECGSMESA